MIQLPEQHPCEFCEGMSAEEMSRQTDERLLSACTIRDKLP